MGRACLLLAASCTWGCIAVPVGESAAALGEPSGDYPSYDERVVLYATNRARVDPAKEGWASFAAVPPLQWDVHLNQSARAHSTDMRDTPCFQHDSCNGTDIWDRITSYYTTSYQYIGENISAGVPDGVTAVHNWIYEIGAPPGETGHRENIFSPDFTFLGAGMAPGGTKYTNYWTQDFVGNPVTPPAMSDGIHFPKTGSTINFGVTWSDAEAPKTIAVVVDGTCHDLTLQRGSGGQAAYEKSLPVGSGCHAYYFRGVSSKKTWLYPDNGSLQVGSGCPLFATGQTPASCDTPTMPAAPDMTQLPDMSQLPDMAKTVTPPGAAPDMAEQPQIPIVTPNPPDEQPSEQPRQDAGCSMGGKPSPLWPILLLTLVFALRRRLG